MPWEDSLGRYRAYQLPFARELGRQLLSTRPPLQRDTKNGGNSSKADERALHVHARQRAVAGGVHGGARRARGRARRRRQVRDALQHKSHVKVSNFSCRRRLDSGRRLTDVAFELALAVCDAFAAEREITGAVPMTVPAGRDGTAVGGGGGGMSAGREVKDAVSTHAQSHESERRK